ncbi:MAG: nuclear transport factor 2 family protein [Chryseolinea sp.]
MKTIFTFCICLLSCSFVMAQSQPTEIASVETAVEKLRNAMLAGDKASLEELAASELSYGHSSGAIEDKAAFVAALVSGKSDFTRIDITKQTVDIIGNIALVRHELRGDANGNTLNLGVLLVWRKDKNEWKLLARQAFKL